MFSIIANVWIFFLWVVVRGKLKLQKKGRVISLVISAGVGGGETYLPRPLDQYSEACPFINPLCSCLSLESGRFPLPHN